MAKRSHLQHAKPKAKSDKRGQGSRTKGKSAREHINRGRVKNRTEPKRHEGRPAGDKVT